MKTNLEIKQIQDALIYTKEAFARVFGVQVKRVRRVMIWAIGFWVWVEGKRPRLYKKSLFTVHFSNFRKESAKSLTISQTSGSEFHVKNSEAGTVSYVGVREKGDKVRYNCGCADFRGMATAFKNPACKHVYAVLNYQGFTSLKEAINTHKAEFDARSALGF